jgi:hypothetical protein
MAGLLAELKKDSKDPLTIILDGGLSSELERQGADLSGHLWSARCSCIVKRWPTCLSDSKDLKTGCFATTRI